jgi:endonuclease/exonuclease/phosphatase family metal-dependent hydrolase
MLKKLQNFTRRMIAGANVAMVLLMLFTGFSDHLHPASFPLLANAGLLFPFFLAINVAFLVFWLVMWPRYVVIPLAGFLLAYAPIRTYMPLNRSQEVPEGAIKVLTYNVFLFVPWSVPKGDPNPILEYIRECDADIVCLQESSYHELGRKKHDAMMKKLYAYSDTACKSRGECMSVYSKFPIISKERIEYESRSNMSCAFKLLIDGDTVIVINNHLETYSLSFADKKEFKNMVKGEMGKDTMQNVSRMLAGKLAEATRKRAPEAEAVADYLKRHRGESIILCGDFNDNPISYARTTIARRLTDCFVESGFGPGISYHENRMYFRIDNIMCSKDWKPYNCKVDRKIALSDHYPMYCWLKKR